jgi:hypothetical protein
MRIYFYSGEEKDDGTHLGTWYTEPDYGNYPQVPRIGDTVWLETKEIKLGKFVVTDVHWSFKNQAVFSEQPIPNVSAEVYVKRYSDIPESE